MFSISNLILLEMQQQPKMCVWDAFGDFSCNSAAASAASASRSVNPFARPNARPDWELFTAQEPLPSGSSLLGGSPAATATATAGRKGSSSSPPEPFHTKETFCGCQAPVV